MKVGEYIMENRQKVEALRKLMKKYKMDAYIIPSFDSHHSEYVTEHFRSMNWISGFTGSAGTVVVTDSDAGIWTDGRYYIQATNQIKGSGIRLFKMSDPGVPSYTEWLSEVLSKNACVGFDGSIFPVTMVREMKNKFESKNISLNIDHDLIDEIWEDRPENPDDKIFVLDVKYAGKSRKEKLDEIRKEMKNKGADFHLLTSLDDIAWLLNLRGSDIIDTPVFLSYVVVSFDKCYLFVDPKKVPQNVKSELESDNIEVRNYEDVKDILSKLSKDDSLMFDPNETNFLLYSLVKCKKNVEQSNVSTMLKAVKNETEIKNMKECELQDGVAMVKFIKWLKESVGKEHITEYSAAQKLDSIRMENKLCVSPSFTTISAYKEHAAMMHYVATEESAYDLKKEGTLLVDSGGQYYNGTTDITRTMALGEVSEEEKRDYTAVLKSHIDLEMAKFLYGSTGSDVDIIARAPIWKYGIDYKCGTGHGVGFFLNVHEGPQGMRQTPNNIKLVDGMDITNEPGIYTEGKYGIRTENMMLVIKDEKTEYGQFYKFEPLTYCPIDTTMVKKDMLTKDEIDWLNNYHKDVYDKLSPFLNEEEKVWLKKQTKSI